MQLLLPLLCYPRMMILHQTDQVLFLLIRDATALLTERQLRSSLLVLKRVSSHATNLKQQLKKSIEEQEHMGRENSTCGEFNVTLYAYGYREPHLNDVGRVTRRTGSKGESENTFSEYKIFETPNDK